MCQLIKLYIKNKKKMKELDINLSGNKIDRMVDSRLLEELYEMEKIN